MSIWLISGVTFLSALIVGLSVIVAFLSRANPLEARLSQLWAPAAAAPASRLRHPLAERVLNALAGLGNLFTASKGKQSRTAFLLVRAGYHSPEAAKLMRGMQVLLPPVLLGFVFASGLYQLNSVFIFGAAGVGGFLIPDFWMTWTIRRRQKRIILGLPDALDLLVVCVEAGLGLDQAILRVSEELRRIHPDLCEEFQSVLFEVRLGKSRADALRELVTRTGVEDLKSLVAVLIQTDRFGTDLAKALRVHSDHLRTVRRQRAEEMAAKTTVKMVPVLVFFIFPALFVVLLGPAVISLTHQLLPALVK
jgi:tight adherence protein C